MTAKPEELANDAAPRVVDSLALGRRPASRQLRRGDLYSTPIVDGRPLRDNTFRRLRGRLRRTLVTPLERVELELGARLLEQPALTRPNTVAVVSPKGGVGKTTTTFVLGNLLATHVKLRVLAVDLNPDFGTLAKLAPDSTRSQRTLIDLLHERRALGSSAELCSYVARLPSGLHLLAAPAEAELMCQMTAALYDELLAFLAPFYEVILLDLGTGITGELAQFAIGRADQAVVVATPEWVTASQVLDALGYMELPGATLVLNQAGRETADGEVLERHFAVHGLAGHVIIAYDEQLRAMLDTGTYSLSALSPVTRVPIKQLGVAVADQLV